MTRCPLRLVAIAVAALFVAIPVGGIAQAQTRASAPRLDRAQADAQRAATEVFRLLAQRNAQWAEAATGFHGRRLAGVPQSSADLFEFIRQTEDADRRDLPEIISIKPVLNRVSIVKQVAGDTAVKDMGETETALNKTRNAVALRNLPGGFARRFEDFKAEIAQIEARLASNTDPQQQNGIRDFLVGRREGFERTNARDIRRIRAVLDGSREWFVRHAELNARLCAVGLVADARTRGATLEPELAEIAAWSGDRMRIELAAAPNTVPRADLSIAILGADRAEALNALFAARSCLPGGGRVVSR